MRVMLKAEAPEPFKELYKKTELFVGIRRVLVVLAPRNVLEVDCQSFDIFHLLPTYEESTRKEGEQQTGIQISDPFDFKHLTHQ
jgi:hypothetical protein